jgi:hypothetical protein
MNLAEKAIGTVRQRAVPDQGLSIKRRKPEIIQAIVSSQ